LDNSEKSQTARKKLTSEEMNEIVAKASRSQYTIRTMTIILLMGVTGKTCAYTAMTMNTGDKRG
jgi:hypothetical protein